VDNSRGSFPSAIQGLPPGEMGGGRYLNTTGSLASRVELRAPLRSPRSESTDVPFRARRLFRGDVVIGRAFGARGGKADGQLSAVVVDVRGALLVGTVGRLHRREPVLLIEAPSSDVALEGPEIEAVGVELLCEVDEP
jgi:hypothetical protein